MGGGNGVRYNVNRIYLLAFILCAVAIVSCNTESEDNRNKRNENWAWWVDDSSGKGIWIPIGNESTVENGKFTLFYFNGHVSEKGRMKNKKKVDTSFFYDLSGQCYGYQLHLSDTDLVYYYKDGHYKTYYIEGSIYCIGTVMNHHEGDNWKVFYKSGKLSIDTKLKDGIGYTTNYFENGQKSSVIYINNSLGKNSYVQEWYENGQLEYDGKLKDGEPDGVLKRYYANGQIKKIWEMKNGIHHGPSKEYYENGQIEGSQTEVNGVTQGAVTKWYKNGAVKAIANFKDDKFDGLQKTFYESGHLMSTASMKAGKLEGEVKKYDDVLGKLTSVELYNNSRRIK